MPTDVIASRAARRPAKPAAPPALVLAARHAADAAISAAMRRKGATLAALAVVVFGSAVSWNALVGQARPHPAPLFGSRAAAPPRAIEPSPPAALPQSALLPSPALLPRPVARPKDLSAEPAATPAVQRQNAVADPIGDLIRTPETGSIKPADADKALATAQRSLTRLGYGQLKPDGVLGQGTRTALERFERDSKLPVTGAIGPRTARALAAKARTLPD